MGRVAKISLFTILISLFFTLSAHSQEGGLFRVRDSLYTHAQQLIKEAGDTAKASLVASNLVDYFRYGSFMDGDAIAIKLAKEYFLSGELRWRGRGELPLLKLYVEFNEKSLLGMTTPGLQLINLEGNRVDLHSIKSNYTLLYFFDHQCNICREEFPQMVDALEQHSHLNITIYAIYTQVDRELMKNFIEEHKEEIERSRAEWHYLYDPDMESGFHRLYNIFTTPKMLLLDQKKVIIGRNLNSGSLKSLLEQESSNLSLMHDIAEEFIPNYLSLFDFSKEGERKNAFEPLYQRLSEESPQMFSTLFFHLFESLANSPKEEHKEAAYQLAKEYIVEKPHLWFNPLFTEERVLNYMAKIENSRVGATFPTLQLREGKDKERHYPSNRSKFSYLYIFTPDCPICKPFSYELKAIYKQIKRLKGEVVAIYLGGDRESVKRYKREMGIKWRVLYYPEQLESPLQNRVECDVVPMTYLLDSSGTIVAKEINTVQLLKLVEE